MPKREHDAVPAEVARLEDALQKAAEGKIKAERAPAHHDNARAPPSDDATTQREIDAEKKAERNNGARRARKNAARSRKAERAIRHAPEKRGKRGGKNPKAVGADNDAMYDIPNMPRAATANRVMGGRMRAGCGAETAADPGMPGGTMFGPNPPKVAASTRNGSGPDETG